MTGEMLVERDSELHELESALKQGQDGTGALVLVEGPLGGGRSSLLRAAGRIAEEAGSTVLRAECVPAERDFDNGVVLQLLEQILLERGGDLLTRLLGGTDSGPTHALLQETLSLVRELAADGPVVLIVDDLQWADPVSLRWLVFLTHRLHGSGIVLLCARLGGVPAADLDAMADLTRSATVSLRAEPLTAAGVRTVLARRCEREPEQRFATLLHEAGAGNPMFLDAVIRAMTEREVPPLAGRAEAALALPLTGPAERLSRCLRAAPRRLGQLACAVKALGEAAEPRMLAELTGFPAVELADCAEALGELGVLSGYLLPPLVDTAMDRATETTLTVGEQELLHAEAAAVLYRGGAPVRRIADHLLATATPPEEWALDVLRAAAGAACGVGAARTGAAYLRHALLHTSSAGAERGRLLVELAEAERRYDLPASIRHLHQAMPLLESPHARGIALCAAPVTRGATYAVGLERIQSVTRELEGSDNFAERELAMRLEARIRFASKGNRTAMSGTEYSVDRLGPNPAVDSAAERELAAVLAYSAMLAESQPRATVAGIIHEILGREPGAGAAHSMVLPTAVPVLLAADSVHGVESWLDTAMDAALRQDDSYSRALIGSQQAALLAGTGRLGQARECAETALTQADNGWLDVTADCAGVLATVAVELGDQELAEFALRACGVDRDRHFVPSLFSMLHGAVAITRGDLPAAIDHLADLGRQLDNEGFTNCGLSPWRSWVAGLCGKIGDQERALALAEEEYRRVTAWGAPAAVGRMLRVRGALAGEREGLALLRESVQVLSESSNQLELAKALVLLGKRLMNSDPQRAESHLRHGHRLAVRCSATRVAEQARRELDGELSMFAVDGPASLTPTEQRVADFAVAGRRNRDIADELGVTLRAVEKTLTSCYRKLGISGRAGLEQAVRERAPQPEDVRGPRAS